MNELHAYLRRNLLQMFGSFKSINPSVYKWSEAGPAAMNIPAAYSGKM